VVCFQILGDRERSFDYHGAVTLEDLETGARVDLDAEQARPVAVARLDASLRVLRRDLEERGAALVECRLAEPFEGPLRAYLTRRQRLP
jgi:hypothetical protein